MQIVIEIPEDTYKDIIESGFIERGFIWDEDKEVAIHAIKNGTPLPKGHGRLIDEDALNLDYEVEMADDWKTAHEIANCVKYAPTIIDKED